MDDANPVDVIYSAFLAFDQYKYVYTFAGECALIMYIEKHFDWYRAMTLKTPSTTLNLRPWRCRDLDVFTKRLFGSQSSKQRSVYPALTRAHSIAERTRSIFAQSN